MNARNRILLFIAAVHIFASPSLFAQPKTYTVRKEDSHIGFSIYKWAVFKEEGRFKDFSGNFVYDRKNPTNSRVEFTVRMSLFT